MGLSDFIFGIIGATSGIAFGWSLTVACSHPQAAIVLLCISCALFAMLGPLWAFGAKGYKMKIRFIISVSTIVIGAAALAFALSENAACAQTAPSVTQTNQGAPNVNGNGNIIYPPPQMQTPMLLMPPPSQVTGATIYGNDQGGPTADITVMGARGQAPVLGADISVVGRPGQSVTGLYLAGPNALTITVGGDGPATGMRIQIGN